MQKDVRGRKSKVSREVVLIRDEGEAIERPKPPADLSDEEADEWIALCAAVPATYFPPATWLGLTQLCRHAVVARHLSELIKRLEKRKKIDIERYRALCKEQRAESAAIFSCLRQMRLTHLASYNHDRAPLPEATPKPWIMPDVMTEARATQ